MNIKESDEKLNIIIEKLSPVIADVAEEVGNMELLAYLNGVLIDCAKEMGMEKKGFIKICENVWDVDE